MLIFEIFLLILCVIIFIISIKNFSNTHKINLNIDEENKKLEEKNKTLKSENKKILQTINDIEKDLKHAKERTQEEYARLEQIQKTVQSSYDNQKEISQKAFEEFCYRLEKDYDREDAEWKAATALLKQSYAELQKKESRELDKIRATRAAAQQALTREKEIKEQLSFYCLSANEQDLADIKVLERIKSQLNKPRILSMLIWSTYWQKPMTALCNNVLGTSTICGIYKVTNQQTNECYIGQSVDIAKRWKDHAKCGLGIDTPANNKLYKAMQEEGIWNFSWELLEVCPREQLDEKEKYYIALYMANDFGYNSTKGNK